MRNTVLTESLILVLMGLAVLRSSPVQGLDQAEITLSFAWSKSTYYQGESGNATISLRSTCRNELEFLWVGIHFDWMQENCYYTLDLKNASKKVPIGGSMTLSPIEFDVYSDAQVGWNEYYVLVFCNEHQPYGWSSNVWNSSTYQICVHDADEKTYYSLDPILILVKVTGADSAGYENPYAKSLVFQAKNEFYTAQSLANQSKWKDAVSHLQSASNLLSQTITEEESYWRHEAYDAVTAARQKLVQLGNPEDPDAKSLRSQAEAELSNAEDSFNQATSLHPSYPSYRDAYDSAQQSVSYADKAFGKEQQYQEQKRQQQQQRIMIFGGISAVAVAVAAGIILIKRKATQTDKS